MLHIIPLSLVYILVHKLNTNRLTEIYDLATF